MAASLPKLRGTSAWTSLESSQREGASARGERKPGKPLKAFKVNRRLPLRSRSEEGPRKIRRSATAVRHGRGRRVLGGRWRPRGSQVLSQEAPTGRCRAPLAGDCSSMRSRSSHKRLIGSGTAARDARSDQGRRDGGKSIPVWLHKDPIAARVRWIVRSSLEGHF